MPLYGTARHGTCRACLCLWMSGLGFSIRLLRMMPVMR